jgi:hypothetical protein
VTAPERGGVLFQPKHKVPARGDWRNTPWQQNVQRADGEGERSRAEEALERYVREGARQMLATALEEEVNAFLGRRRYELGKAFRGYRNGYQAVGGQN